jgi:multidrug resistance efflux pump
LRLSWLLGLALLTGSLIGAGHVLQSGPSDLPNGRESKPAERSGAGANGVHCHGAVTIEGVPDSFVALAPAQQGEVTEVLVYEGQSVHAGDILLRVNDEPFQTLMVQAKIGVKLAEQKLAQARRGLEQHRQGVEAQQAVVEAARHKLAAAEFQLKRARALKAAFQGNDDEISAAGETVAAMRSGVEAERANLRRLEAGRPDAEVEEATQGVALAEAKVRQAQDALDNCLLKARTDGTVLRLGVTKGSLITAQTRQPPVLFAPAGPRVVRAEITPEFAHRVQKGMPAVVHDESNVGFTWPGTVKYLSDAYLPRRGGSELLSLGGGNDTWMLECVVELAPSQSPPRLGQRVRVSIGTHRTP